MRTFVFIAAISLSTFFFLSLSPSRVEAECKECHSKNPKMVRMHEALEFKGCFDCHFQGRIAEPQDMPRQMRTDPLCRDCHAAGPLPDPKELKKSSSPRRGPVR